MKNLTFTRNKCVRRYQTLMVLLTFFMFAGISVNAQTLTATISDVGCSPAPCPVNGNGAIDLTVTGGTPPYTYVWSSATSNPLTPPCESFFDLYDGLGANPVAGPDNTIVEDAVNTQGFTINGSVLTINQAVFSGGATIDEEIIDNSQQTGYIGLRTGVDHDQLVGGVGAANMSRTFNFNPPIAGLEMLVNDLDNNDVAIVNLSLGGVAVPIAASDIISTGSNVATVGANQFESITDAGLGPSLNGSIFFKFASSIDEIEIIYYDDVAGPGVIGSEGGSYTVDFPDQCPEDLTCLEAGTYTVVVTDAAGNSATASYTVDPLVACDPCEIGDLTATAGGPFYYWEDDNGNPLPLPDPCVDTNWANFQTLNGTGANPVPGGVDNSIVENAINGQNFTIRGATLTVNNCVFNGGATIDEEIINDTQLNGTFALRTGVDHDQLTGGVGAANMSRTFTFDRPVCDLSMFLNDIDGNDVAIVNLKNNGAIVPLTTADYTFTGTNVAPVGSNQFEAISGGGLNNSDDGGILFDFTSCIDEIEIIYYDNVAGPGVPGSEGGSYSVNFPPECDYTDTQTDLPIGCYTVYSKDGAAVEVSEVLCVEGCPDGAIGNIVYLDENGNGIQDLGEAGIPGVTVVLSGDANATVVTDANGGYIFPDLLDGNYTITVDESTLPSGMTQTTNPINPGGDLGNQTNGYNVTLVDGEEDLTGDFGYNYGDATGNTGLAALGNKVWLDADGDGVQDAGEAGIGGVTVTLYSDSNGDGVVDPATDAPFTAAVDQNGNTGTGSTTTDPDGTYYFSSLPPGQYVVVVDPASGGLPGKNQTGDPDEPGRPATSPDDMSDPVVLAPGDNHVNLDFGYENPAGNDIGDVIYMDADADGTQDPGEEGIEGVTVQLLDSNGDVIATTTTDENGEFLFPGLDDGTYTVVVNDTDNVLDDMENTEDPDGGNDGMSTVVLAGADELDEDFGYTPEGQDPGEGMIGDVVFLDYDQNGTVDPGEGLEGVVVELLDANGNVIATTTTDENGNYYFPGLIPTRTYSVQVDPSTLPAGVSQTVDPDGGNDNTASTDLNTLPDGIDLTLDFGYTADTPGSIGSLIWEDTNADGINDGPNGPDGIAGTDDDEPGLEGVTVDLYLDTDGDGVLEPGEPLLTTVMTDASGNYLFPNLPTDGTAYLVDVSDENQVLTGYWHSIGAPNVDDNSQEDAYPVVLGAGNPINDLTADFGYYIEPGSLGGIVWIDRDRNGLQDDPANEDPIPGVEVQLMITYPDGTMITLTDVTDADGAYSFEDLLLDENYNGPNSGVTYEIKVPSLLADAQAAFPAEAIQATVFDAGADDLVDADDPTGVIAEPTQGLSDVTPNLTNPGAEPTHMSYDFAVQVEEELDGAIGNYVFLDENDNGIQDLGEAGIAGVTVNLSGDATATTVTDANGGYIFPDLPEGSYTVTVDESTLPNGMAQTSNPILAGADLGNQTNGYSITLAAGEENMTGDFGYNLADAPGNAGVGALGDKVWLDANSDGVQDAGEAGIGGVTVTVYGDSNGDGVVDPTVDAPFTAAIDQNGNSGTGSTTTEPDGTYHFSDLPAGLYAVVVDPASGPLATYTQTGDPDEPGRPATSPDDMSDAVVIAPGDNYVNLDFGYNNPAGNDIGDVIYFDTDADGTQDPGEEGIEGVTVTLLDSNGDPIATTTTDENGEFLFPGLEDGTYTVVVSDTDNVLDDLKNTDDPDGGNDGMSTVVLAGSDELDEDFGYTPEDQDPGEGMIGDVIFLDYDQDGAPSPGEGIEGVVVELLDANGNIVATTTTDENGEYHFPGLIPTRVYTVQVDPSSLPAGVSPTVDPDGGNDNTADADLNASPGGIDLTLDFGYEADTPGSIGSTVWADSNADGINDGPNGPDGVAGTDDDEPGLEGVTIDLYEDTNGNGVLDAGEPLLTSTTTGPNGEYLFPNLPASGNDYIVDVTDEAQVLNGCWHSLGTAGVNDNSQDDAYAVTLGGGSPTDDLTADFGYYKEPGAIGGIVWLDGDGSSIQNDDPANEYPVPGAEVQLMITYPDGTMLTLTSITDADGAYSFPGLLLDENYNGPNSGVTYEVKVPNLLADAQAAYPNHVLLPSVPNLGADDFIDADDPTGVTAEPTQGLSDTTPDLANPAGEPTHMSYDFAVIINPLFPLELMYFNGVEVNCAANLAWATAIEVETSHFNVQKSTDGIDFTTIDRIDAAGNSTSQVNYSFVDKEVARENYYRLEMIDIDGTTTYSDIVHLVAGNCSNTILDVFPNPTNDKLTISFNGIYDNENTNVIVTDVLGRTVLIDNVITDAGINVVNLDVRNFANATYFIVIRGEKGWFTKAVPFVKVTD